MENKKFNFVLVQYSRDNIHLSAVVNAYALEDFGCDGVEEFSLEESRVDEILGERAYSGGDVPESLIDEVEAASVDQDSFTYKYFFYQNDYETNSSDFVFFIKENYPELPLFTAQKNFEDWNAEWKKFYTPIIVSERLEIVPEWLIESRMHSPAEKIFIYPGMGFGTGTHETTYLCLCLFDKISDQLKCGASCLDFGCGSGILGITALKTKQMPTLFCDIDKNALDNCAQNIVLNFEGENLAGSRLVIRNRYTPAKYDLVFANILENILILEKEVILESMQKNAYLIVSGLLNHQVETIISQYSTLEKISVVTKNDWSAILFKRKS
ncbi:MAG: 50S ribosomal protein L11 methyltransferase [Bacteriovorax sp.]